MTRSGEVLGRSVDVTNLSAPHGARQTFCDGAPPSAAPSELLKWVVEPVLRILDRNVAREVLLSLKTGYRRKRAAAAGRRRRSLHAMARRRRSDERGSTNESRRDRRNRWLAVASERILLRIKSTSRMLLVQRRQRRSRPTITSARRRLRKSRSSFALKVVWTRKAVAGSNCSEHLNHAVRTAQLISDTAQLPL